MIIAAYSTANQLILNGSLNPAFLGVSTQAGSTVTEQVPYTPPPVTQKVTVQPPDYVTTVTIQPDPVITVIDGQQVKVVLPPVTKTVTVTPPAIEQEVTVQPADITVSVQKTQGGSLANAFEAVGVVRTDQAWPRLCCLVKGNLVAAAHHYTLPAGSTITFYTGKGPITATVTGLAGTFNDFEVYRLDRDLAGSVAPAKIGTLRANAAYYNAKILTFGLLGSRNGPFDWIPVCGSNTIAKAVSSSAMAVCVQRSSVTLEPGDSGGPTFIQEADGSWTYLGSTFGIMTSTYNVNLAPCWASKLASL